MFLTKELRLQLVRDLTQVTVFSRPQHYPIWGNRELESLFYQFPSCIGWRCYLKIASPNTDCPNREKKKKLQCWALGGVVDWHGPGACCCRDPGGKCLLSITGTPGAGAFNSVKDYFHHNVFYLQTPHFVVFWNQISFCEYIGFHSDIKTTFLLQSVG